MRIPPVVKTLLLLNLAAYILDLLVAVGPFRLHEVLGLYYVGSPLFRPFQVVTYMFMHGGLMHIFFNMFALWMFGRIMEQAWGGRRFAVYYLLCGVGAALVQEAGQGLGLIPPYSMTIGASGAVYGILLAFGMTFPNERLFIIPIPFPIKAKWFVIIYAAIEVFESLGMQDGVAHMAHLGGMLFGLVLILYWRGKARRRPRATFWADSGGTRGGGFGGSYDRGGRRTWWGARKKEAAGGAADFTTHASDHAYNSRRREENEVIDHILDKIRRGGYASLTEEEKRQLFDASQR